MVLLPLKPLFITCGCISSRNNFSYFVIPSDIMVSVPISSIELASAAERTKVMLYPYPFSSRATLTVLIQRLYPGMLRNKTFPVINVAVKVYNSNRAAWKRSMVGHVYIFLCPVEKMQNMLYNLLRPFLCFTTNQFAQKFKFFANLMTHFVNICNIY